MTTLFWTSAMLACLALPENGDALELEPPLDPIAGTFAAVAYWRTEPAPETATFRLQDASGTCAQGAADRAVVLIPYRYTPVLGQGGVIPCLWW